MIAHASVSSLGVCSVSGMNLVNYTHSLGDLNALQSSMRHDLEVKDDLDRALPNNTAVVGEYDAGYVKFALGGCTLLSQGVLVMKPGDFCKVKGAGGCLAAAMCTITHDTHPVKPSVKTVTSVDIGGEVLKDQTTWNGHAEVSIFSKLGSIEEIELTNTCERKIFISSWIFSVRNEKLNPLASHFRASLKFSPPPPQTAASATAADVKQKTGDVKWTTVHAENAAIESVINERIARLAKANDVAELTASEDFLHMLMIKVQRARFDALVYKAVAAAKHSP